MKLQLPETLLTQPVETPTGSVEGVPLEASQLDPILSEAVESQPEQPQPEPEPAQTETAAAKPKTAENTTKSKKSLPWVGIGLAALAALVAVASQGQHGTALRVEQPHAPQPAGGSRGIVWE
jgi:hypothetical protein